MDEWTNGLTFTFGTPANRHGPSIVVHFFANTAFIPRERATVKGNGAAAANVVNINGPSLAGSSIVDECDEDKDDDGVDHKQPSTFISISIFYGQPLEGERTAGAGDPHNALPSRTLPNTRPAVRAASDGQILVLQP